MCRLFGLHAGPSAVDAEFWLLDAPDNLEDQSHRNADGFGIGTFTDDGAPVVEKAPRPAWQDTDFATAAHRLHGRTFVAHVRRASTGAPLLRNTHPFLQDARLFAHNGALDGLPVIDERLRDMGAGSLVDGDTDSERVFALITAETRRVHGDLHAGIAAAVTWLQTHVPIASLNFVLTEPTAVWAFRYPATKELFVASTSSAATAPGGPRLRGSRLAAGTGPAAPERSVVVASERMDETSTWRLLEPGELLHVDSHLAMRSSRLHPRRAA
jgi:glutamine amidotransferase